METGNLVWIPDNKQGWVKGIITKRDNKGGVDIISVKREDGEGGVMDVKIKDVHSIDLMAMSTLGDTQDLTKLAALNEPALLEALQQRYQNNKIYTYTSRTILLAVNPFQNVKALYGDDVLARYMNASIEDADKLPPHAFAIANGAYKAMIEKGCNQSILVSGESGAGKTETTKIVLRFLSGVSRLGSGRARAGSKSGTQAESVSARILQANPLLEAFGNAKTVRNDNSSRFGKLIHLHFDRNRLHLQGASITTYLLEKARLAQQNEGERNYHIFYELAAGATKEQRKKWRLPNNIEDSWYCSQSGTVERADIKDVDQFQKTRQAMEALGLTEDEIENVFRLTCGILHIGDIAFAPSAKANDEGSIVDNESHSASAMDAVCDLLGIPDKAVFAQVLTTRRVAAKGEVYTKPLTPIQAVEARDALASTLYERLFGWLVWKINTSLGDSLGESSSHSDKDIRRQSTKGEAPILRYEYQIGCLDVFGFEVFENNSFEQLCINYCNEQLQSQFNEHVFTLEQKEYEKEGVDWTYIEFPDNQPCIDMIESKPIGLLSLVDEECLYPGGSDKSMASKLYDNLPKKFDRFESTNNQKRDLTFTVKHFAGNVEYKVIGFYKKNKNELRQDTVDLIRSSSHPLAKILFPSDAESAAGGADMATYFESLGKGKKSHPAQAASNDPHKSSKQAQLQQTTVGSHFKLQLSTAMSVIRASTPHYVRCLKPNDQNVAGKFNRARMLSQLRYSGVVEVIKVARAGYPTRYPLEEFALRFAVLSIFGEEKEKGKSKKSSAASAAQNVQKLINIGDSKAIRDLCLKVMKGANLEHGRDYQVGRSKVFMRQETCSQLEIAKARKIKGSVLRIQRSFRAWLKRTKNKRYARKIQKWWRGVSTRKRIIPILRDRKDAATFICSDPHMKRWIKHIRNSRAGIVPKKKGVDSSAANMAAAGANKISKAFGTSNFIDPDSFNKIPLPYVIAGAGVGALLLHQLLGLYFIIGATIVCLGLLSGTHLASVGDVESFESRRQARAEAAAARKSARIAREMARAKAKGKSHITPVTPIKKPIATLSRSAPPLSTTSSKTSSSTTSSTTPTTSRFGKKKDASTTAGSSYSASRSDTINKPVSVSINAAAMKRFGGLALKKQESMQNAKRIALEMQKNGKLKGALDEYYKNPNPKKAHDVFSSSGLVLNVVDAPMPPEYTKKPSVPDIVTPPQQQSTIQEPIQESKTRRKSFTEIAASSVKNVESLRAPEIETPPSLPPNKPVLQKKGLESQNNAKINVKDEVKDEQEQDMIYRAILTMFFEEHAPTRIADVDILLKKHKGHEDKLLEDLTHHFTALDAKAVGVAPQPPPRATKQTQPTASSYSSYSSSSSSQKPAPITSTPSKRITLGGGGFFGSPMNIGAGLSATFNNFLGDDSKKKDTKAKSGRFGFGSKHG